MDKRTLVLTAAILSVGGIGLAATPALAQADPQAGQQQAPAAQQSAAPADKSASDQAAQTAGDQQGAAQASEADARQALSQIANAAISKDALQSISQQVCQKSQQRIGDLSQQADQSKQIDQSVDQLKTAYKDKFQQDLDLSKSPDTVFTAQFFQIGGIGDQARQASERQAPDRTNDTSGAAASDANSKAASADQANRRRHDDAANDGRYSRESGSSGNADRPGEGRKSVEGCAAKRCGWQAARAKCAAAPSGSCPAEG